jgi:hypothetical protein
MSDGNITHHHSLMKNNTSLGASPDKCRIRTNSTSSTSSSSPIKSLKRPFTSTTSSEEDEENMVASASASNITSNFANLEFKSVQAKKSYSRLPLISAGKRRRVSLEATDGLNSLSENEIIGQHDSSTPVSALPNRGRNNRNVRFIMANSSPEDNKSGILEDPEEEDITTRFSTPVRNDGPAPNVVTTPFRTPKSLKGKPVLIPSPEENRILGTPDYLAPELLLRQSHSYGVDWWGLGVCLYEFMTGIPPFMDDTPDEVFENILNLKMEWPEEEGEALSVQAVNAIKALLTLDPEKRADFETIQKMDLFKDLDWTNLTEQEAPFTPQPDDETDTGYFDARNEAQDWKVSQIRDGENN